jgi:hypothetical protein
MMTMPANNPLAADGTPVSRCARPGPAGEAPIVRPPEFTCTSIEQDYK